MTNVVFGTYTFRQNLIADKQQIFDIVRKKFIALTPEEWVRQHCIHYLIFDRNFPKGLLAVEKEIILNGRKKRCDIVVYNHSGKPVLIVECKASSEVLNDATVVQILNYNQVLQVPYIWISNGTYNYFFNLHQSIKSADTVPYWKDISSQ